MDHFLFNTPRLLVGTKSDLRSDGKRISELNANGQQLITIEQVKKKNKQTWRSSVLTNRVFKAEALAKRINTQYIECSAKTNTNITKVIHMAAGLIINHRKGGLKTKICTLL